MGQQNTGEYWNIPHPGDQIPEGPTRPHEAYEISKSRDFEPDFLISNLISVDFKTDFCWFLMRFVDF
jgi:hypothetical protein